jgi:hypothetical protein
MIVKKDGKDKLENLVFEIFVFFTPYIYRAQILPAVGVLKTQLLLPDILFVLPAASENSSGNSALGLDSTMWVNMESNLRGLDLLSSVTSKPWELAKMLLEI